VKLGIPRVKLDLPTAKLGPNLPLLTGEEIERKLAAGTFNFSIIILKL
jgi:hypothetical protein